MSCSQAREHPWDGLVGPHHALRELARVAFPRWSLRIE